MSFLVGYLLFAWTEPVQTPPGCPSGTPGCNVPINEGPTGQAKVGGLLLNTGGAIDALIIDKGYIQIKANNGVPGSVDCDEDTERGRMILDYLNNRLYICNGAVRGWDYINLL